MKTKKQGHNYIIQDYPDTDPLKLNRKKTDRILHNLERSLRLLSKTIADTYDDDTELYWFIHDNIYLPDSYYLCDTRLPESISDIYRSVKDLQEFLQEHDDEILPPEHYVTLADLGFKDMFPYNRLDETHIYERTVKDLGEKEITEEVVIHNSDIFRRQRTTLWEITPGCKSSKSITYKKMRMTKKLERAAKNTIEILNKKADKK